MGVLPSSALWALSLAGLGCVLPDYEAARGGGSSSGGGGAGGQGGGGGGTQLVCPNAFGKRIGSDAGQGTLVKRAVVHTVTGATIVSGEHGNNSLSIVAGETVPYDNLMQNRFVAGLDADGNGSWAHAVKCVGTLSVQDVVPLSEGSVLWLLHAQGDLTIDDTLPGMATFTDGGGIDSYAVAIGPDGAIDWVVRTQGAGNEYVTAATESPDGQIYLAGHTGGDLVIGDGASPGSSAFRPFFAAVRRDTGDFVAGSLHVFDSNGAKVASVVARPGEIFLFGDFTGAFPPGFAVPDPPDAAMGGEDLFVVRLTEAGKAIEAWGYGIPGRPDYAQRMLSLGDDFVIFAQSTPSGSPSEDVVFAPVDTSTQPVSNTDVASYVGRISGAQGDMGDGRWLHLLNHKSPSQSKVRMSSMVQRETGVAVGFWHDGAGFGTSVDGQTSVAPDVDSLLLTLDGDSGATTGVLTFGAPGMTDDPVPWFSLDASACGDLLFGPYEGDVTIGGETFGAGTVKRSLVLFQPAPGLTFPAP